MTTDTLAHPQDGIDTHEIESSLPPITTTEVLFSNGFLALPGAELLHNTMIGAVTRTRTGIAVKSRSNQMLEHLAFNNPNDGDEVYANIGHHLIGADDDFIETPIGGHVRRSMITRVRPTREGVIATDKDNEMIVYKEISDESGRADVMKRFQALLLS